MIQLLNILQIIKYKFYSNRSKMIKRQMDKGAVFYHIRVLKNSVQFSEAVEQDLYNERGEGFVRKAVFINVQRGESTGRFVDREYEIQAEPGTRLVRLYDLYKRETDIFSYNENNSSYFNVQNSYCSFMGESGNVSYEYLRTLFITQTVNERGYYQYFVKRDGEYYVEETDDLIPVDKATYKPIWGLDLSYPWQILLLKFWLKELGSFKALYAAEPFRFLQAFGLPEYRVFNFRKELKFLRNERVNQSEKDEKLRDFVLNRVDATIIAQTINSPSVSKVGLIPNTAGYRLIRLSPGNQPGVYLLRSSVPCHWVGSHSPVINGPLNNIYNSQMSLDLQRNVALSESQVLTYFNKFYVAPNKMADPIHLKFQDSLSFNANAGEPVWIKFFVTEADLLGISIQLPKIRGRNDSYPQFRYFLSKRCDEQQMSRSHFREDIAGSRLQQNMYITSNCDKWDYYRIDYIQGYSNHAGSFTNITPGEYVIYVNIDANTPFKVRFDSQVRMEEPQQYRPTAQEAKEIFDSTFFGISRDNGIQTTFNQQTFDESITLNNSFEEIGYGSICIKTLQKARHKVAMRIYPDKLRAAGLQLLSHYDDYQQDQNRQKNLVLISAKGRPEIVVLQRIGNKSTNSLGEIFPPPGAVQFFKVTPNNSLLGTSNINTTNNNMLLSSTSPMI